jgi:hypothetical protein
LLRYKSNSSKNIQNCSAASLDNLSVSGELENTSYYAGESFDPTGLTITANYDDESSADVTQNVPSHLIL